MATSYSVQATRPNSAELASIYTGKNAQQAAEYFKLATFVLESCKQSGTVYCYINGREARSFTHAA